MFIISPFGLLGKFDFKLKKDFNWLEKMTKEAVLRALTMAASVKDLAGLAREQMHEAYTSYANSLVAKVASGSFDRVFVRQSLLSVEVTPDELLEYVTKFPLDISEDAHVIPVVLSPTNLQVSSGKMRIVVDTTGDDFKFKEINGGSAILDDKDAVYRGMATLEFIEALGEIIDKRRAVLQAPDGTYRWLSGIDRLGNTSTFRFVLVEKSDREISVGVKLKGKRGQDKLTLDTYYGFTINEDGQVMRFEAKRDLPKELRVPWSTTQEIERPPLTEVLEHIKQALRTQPTLKQN